MLSRLVSHRVYSALAFHTFGPFDQLYVHDSLGEAPPAPYAQSDQTAGLLQRLYRPAVGHLPDVGVIHPDYTVVHPGEDSGTHRRDFNPCREYIVQASKGLSLATQTSGLSL